MASLEAKHAVRRQFWTVRWHRSDWERHCRHYRARTFAEITGRLSEIIGWLRGRPASFELPLNMAVMVYPCQFWEGSWAERTPDHRKLETGRN
jgi:hypothetical protein